MPGDHLLERREVREARRTALEPVGLVGAIGDEVDAELALRRLDRGVGLALGHAVAFGHQLEVVDERFHVALHVFAARRADLRVVDHHRPRVLPQPLHALRDDAVRLAQLLHTDEVAVVTVAVDADGDIELHLLVDIVGLLLTQIPGYP